MKPELLFLASLAFGTGVFAQYPAKPIRLVVPFPAGESVDATARLVGQSWSAALGQQILVDNRGGAGGTIGSGPWPDPLPTGTPSCGATSGRSRSARASTRNSATTSRRTSSPCPPSRPC